MTLVLCGRGSFQLTSHLLTNHRYFKTELLWVVANIKFEDVDHNALLNDLGWLHIYLKYDKTGYGVIYA